MVEKYDDPPVAQSWRKNCLRPYRAACSSTLLRWHGVPLMRVGAARYFVVLGSCGNRELLEFD